MNGLRLPQSMMHDPNKPNIFTMRENVYNEILKNMLSYIDDMYDVCEPEKQHDIMDRKPEGMAYNNSLFLFYKGIQIPMIDKNKIILDGIEYLPILQIVDKPIHSQKNGKFIVVKTNQRYSLIKMSGTESMVLTKTGCCPLFIYMLYLYDADMNEMLNDFGYEITSNESEAEYFIPDITNLNPDNIIMIKPCIKGSWKHFLLSPYIKSNIEFHQSIINDIIDSGITITEEPINQNESSDSDESNTDEPIVSDELIPADNSEDDIDINNYTLVTDEVLKMEIKRRENLPLLQKTLVKKISTMIYHYFQLTKKNKKKIVKRSHISNTLYKFIFNDMTLDNVSILGMIQSCIRNDIALPEGTDIGDLNQKMLRYLEWFALKLTSVRSYPEKCMIMEVAKVEQKLTYSNVCNPMAELATLSRGNIFGKGGLPREACGSSVRNLHPTYYGVIDPSDSPSGANIGLSLHMVPEIRSFDLHEDIKQSDDINIFKHIEY